jgi:hypothetical protein
LRTAARAGGCEEPYFVALASGEAVAVAVGVAVDEVTAPPPPDPPPPPVALPPAENIMTTPSTTTAATADHRIQEDFETL